MLWLTASLVPGVEVAGFVAALLGAILLAALKTVVRHLGFGRSGGRVPYAEIRRRPRQRRRFQSASFHEPVYATCVRRPT
jgi:Mycobacterial 4 TMS phage holin, superfamily IV